MRDTRNDEGGIRDENILARSECAHIIVLKLIAGCGMRDAGCGI